MFIMNTNIIVAIPVEVRVADAVVGSTVVVDDAVVGSTVFAVDDAVVGSTVFAVDDGSTVDVSDPGLKSIL